MDYIKGTDRNQLSFLPECIEDYIDENNPVRLIDAFVDSLDLDELGFTKSTPNEIGRPAYDPRDLLKLYIYGYMNRIRSSRKLMKECRRNIELFYLLNKLTPDFRTIADFRKDNAIALKNTFKAFSKLCLKLDLFEKELLAVDGTKVRAVNSKDNSYNEEVLKKKIANIEEKIEKYLSSLETEDDNSSNDMELSEEKVSAAIDELNERKVKYEDLLDEMIESGDSQMLTTDPDCRRMHSKDGFHCCYNVQTAVDGGSHLIAGYEVTNHNVDAGLLYETVKNAKELLEIETITAVADKGYDSKDDILDCILDGTLPKVALKFDKVERNFEIPYEEAEITEEERNSLAADDIYRCMKAGVLPSFYEGKGLILDVQEKNHLSCFLRDEDGQVTCPMGNILKTSKQKKNKTVYFDRMSCRHCRNKCTTASFKEVAFGPNTNCVPVMVFGDPTAELQKIPDDAKISPANHTLSTSKVPKKKVVLRIPEEKELLKQRKCLAEHPFGTVKWYHGAHYLLCKGIEKASAEMGLAFLAYNMTRAINMVGIRKIIEAI